MPQKNGLDFLRELRQQKNEIPFVMFTGRGREEIAVAALNLGADSYVNKHGSPETVYAELSDAVQKSVERKLSKRLLQASEGKYRTLVEESLQGIVVAQGAPPSLVFANASFAETLGYSIDEITAFSPPQVASLVHPEDQKIFFERYAQRVKGQHRDSTLDIRAIRKDGTNLWLRVSSNRILYHGKPALLGMFLNIDNDKKASENSQKNESRYRELANSLPEMVFETDAKGRITFYNRPGCEITGYTPEDLAKGLNIIEVIAPEDRERAKANIQKVIAGQPNGPNEYKLVKRDGELLPVLAKTTPFLLENGSIGLRGILVDITERKEVERKLTENQKHLQLMNEKLRVVGSLARHDVRNKLCGITGNSYLLKKKLEDKPELIICVQNIEQACKEIERLFDFVKVYEQLGADTLTHVDLHQAFCDAVRLFLDQELPLVKGNCEGLSVLADSTLTQLFYNLIGNSLKHGKKVTEITLNFKIGTDDDLTLVYSDDGIGIPQENKPRLFTVGFSTGGSTGYGLYLTRRMVDVYGWTIREDGEPEKGARFIINIPSKDANGQKSFHIKKAIPLDTPTTTQK
jgi:PAS domain S-box-containing protein